MAASLFFLPFPTAFTSNGLPAAGAKAHFYTTGTLNPADTFTTSALTTAHPNPVVANAVGYLPSIYLDSAVTYRLIIKDALGVTLSDTDPYIPGTAANAALLQPYQTNAANSATAAGASQTAAANSASAASTSATNAANSATAAGTSATNAATSATNSANSATTASAAAAAASANTRLPGLAYPDGAVGDGMADDAAALAVAVATGKLVWIAPDKTYAFGTRLIVPSGGGFIGGGKLLMLTGAGQFDAQTYAGGSYDRTIGIFAEGVASPRIEAKIELQANAGIRTAIAVWVRNCTDPHVDVECFGFKETRFGIVEMNSNKGRIIANVYAHDCTTNTTTLPTMQITGLSVDSNRLDTGGGPINSDPMIINGMFKRITLGAAARATYGPQTDGLNLQGSGYGGHSGTVVTDTVDEPLDAWTDGNSFTVNARKCFWGVKLLYGASQNNITGSIDTYEKSAVVYAGAVAGQKSTYGNRVRMTASGGGAIGTQSDVSVVRVEDPTGVFEANGNVTEVTYLGDGTNLDYVAQIKSGSDNTVTIEGAGHAVSVGLITSTGTGNVVRRIRPTLVRAHLSANQAYADLATIICNTETIDRHGEYDPVTGVFTAKCPGTYRIKFKSSLSVSAGQGYGSYIRKNATDVSRKRETNTGAAGATLGHEHSALVQLIAGDTLSIRNDGVATTTTFSGTEATYIEIEEVS